MGHGVGMFFNFHEGPIQLSSGSETSLEPGMVCFNGHGYHRQGFFVILLEILSLAPFQPSLIQPNLLGQCIVE